MTKRKALGCVARALKKVVGKTYGAPQVLGKRHGFRDWTLCWDGPYDWTMITAGSSVFAGELNRYSLEAEEPIAKAMEEVRAAGYYLEPINNCQVAIWEI